MPLGPVSQPGASARLPTAPTSISATAVSGGQAAVSFVASTNPGKPSGNYVVTSSPSSFTASGASSPITVTGLATGTAYTFTVVKQSGSGISSATSGASGSITAFVPPTFGTQTGSSTVTPPSGGSTTGISNVYTTTGTLSKSVGGGATFYDYERISGTGGGVSGDSLSGLAEDTNHEWRVRVTNSHSTFALTTRVTPNGSATTVSVEYGTDGNYGSSAGSVSIGAGTSEITSSWSLGESTTAATIFWRATATYAGGATVQTTGTISRAITVSNGTSTGVFRTYTTRTTQGFKSVSKPSYGADITINSYTLIGGGGAGGNSAGAFLGYGGGGGGNIQTGGSMSTSAFLLSTPGPGGRVTGGAAGTASTLAGASFATITAAGGTGALGNFQGGSSGNGNAGFAGGGSAGGGGGGISGAASDINGGSGYFGVGPGGPGFFSTGFSSGYGSYVNGAEGNYGAGGKANFDGANGYTEITWVGPA